MPQEAQELFASINDQEGVDKAMGWDIWEVPREVVGKAPVVYIYIDPKKSPEGKNPVVFVFFVSGFGWPQLGEFVCFFFELK